eukprot:TRINITY_DN10736_c0_g1_i2.p1 TRINITY_DN10736_c0_g1~~TRINITY_DN10736_c0_g1_i2.p1  ORF type:complete len:122 (+),score=15.24 TRINITY_DN10736_c0_g1_i2:53-418(+)
MSSYTTVKTLYLSQRSSDGEIASPSFSDFSGVSTTVNCSIGMVDSRTEPDSSPEIRSSGWGTCCEERKCSKLSGVNAKFGPKSHSILLGNSSSKSDEYFTIFIGTLNSMFSAKTKKLMTNS